MERYLVNLAVWCWTYPDGPRNYPGFHITAKTDACDVLLSLLAFLEGQPDGTKRTMPLRRLDREEERRITGGRRFRDFRKMQIVVHDDNSDLHQMCFWEDGNTIVLEFVRTYLAQFARGLQDVKKGTGDYCICPEENKKRAEFLGPRDRQSRELWFWPCFGHLGPIP